MDAFSFVIGFIVGVLVANVVVELILYKGAPGKVSNRWDLSNERDLRVCATRLGNVNLPENARVIIDEKASVPPEIARRCIVRKRERITMNFAVSEDRAYLFLRGEISSGSPAFIATDDAIISEFSRIFKEMWEEGKTMIYERVPASRMAEYLESFVSVSGVILNPLRVFEDGSFKVVSEGRVIMAKLAPNSKVSPEDVLSLRGTQVELLGKVREDENGYFIEVIDIRRKRGAKIIREE